MTTKNDAFTASLERLNALLAWWGVPNSASNGKIDEQFKNFRQLVAKIQKTGAEAVNDHLDDLLADNDRLMRSFQGLIGSRSPEEAMAAQSDILATYLECASLHAKRWVELTQMLQDCFATIAAETAQPVRQEPRQAAAASPAASERRAAEKTSKQAVEA